MADSLTWRCRQSLTAYDSKCADQARFWIYPDGHPADGTGTCTQHLGKAVRTLLAANTTLNGVIVGDIARMENKAVSL